MDKRQAVAQGNLALSVAVCFALALFANYFGAKYWTQWDWSQGGINSLSSKTEHVLAELAQPIEIISFITESTQLDPSVLEELRHVLDAYAAANPARVKVEFKDPLRDPASFQALMTGGKLADPINVVIVKAGSRSKSVSLDEMLAFDFAQAQGGAPPVKGLTAEAALTGAILSVTRERKPVVRFATGHGEREPGQAVAGGLSALADALRKDDIDVETWNALNASAVPALTDVLVVAAPQHAWLAAERDALARYLDGGGRALLLIEPQFERSGGQPALAPTGLEPVLAAWGIADPGAIAIDPAQPIQGFGPEVFAAATIGAHPVTTSLGGYPLAVMLSRALTRVSPAPTNVTVSTLSETSPEGYAKKDFSQGSLGGAERKSTDLGGPVAIALAAERTAPPPTPGGSNAPEPPQLDSARRGRLVVVGDVEVATNQLVGQAANFSFTLNALAWLREESQALGIPAKDRALAKLFLTDEQSSLLLLIAAVLMPLVAVAAGTLVWWRRRRA